MIIQWKVTLPQLTGTKERRAYICLPNSYDSSPQKRYPVLYMFDGHNVFFDADATYGKCWGMKEYMEYSDTELIIAAVECNHSPDHGRLREYSPFDLQMPDIGPIEGLGDLTMEWLIHSFKKEVDQQFRTLPDREHTYIAGSSMGGLMSLYAALQYNSYFSRAAALSPSIWVAADKLNALVENVQVGTDTIIYMDYGECELGNHKHMLQYFSQFSALLMEHSILLISRIVPGGEHCEASWEKQIPYFLHAIMYK